MEKNNSNMPKDLGEVIPTDPVGELNNSNMPKNLSFKDFMTVDYTYGGMPELIAHNAKKRHRGIVGESTEQQDEDLETEALSHAQRIKASIRMKKMSKRIKIARDRAMRRSPDQKTVNRRAMKGARKAILKKMTKGQDKGELSFARRQDLEKRMKKMGPRIQRLAKKLIPSIRKLDRERKKSKAASTEK